MKPVKHSLALFAAVLILGTGQTWADTAPEQDKTAQLKLDAVVVSATREKVGVFDAPASVVKLDKEELERSQAANLKDALDDIPNVDFDNGNFGPTQRPSIRGLEQTQIIMKVDGVRQTFRGIGGIGRNPAQMDPSLLKSVEVLRGPASTLHGSGGMGGVITMTTKDAADFLKPGQAMGASVKAGYRSGSEDSYGTASAYGKSGIFDFLVSGTHHDYRDYHSSNPGNGSKTIDRDGDNTSALFKTTLRPNMDHRLALSFNTFNEDIENGARRYQSDQKRVAAMWDWYRGNGLVDLKAAFQYVDREDKRATDIQDYVDDFNSLGFDVYNTFSGRFTKGLDWRLTLGTDGAFDQQKGEDSGAPDPSRPDADAMDLGAFTRLELDIMDQFTLTPAVRYTRYERQANTLGYPDQEDEHWSPKLSGQWRPNDWLNLFASYSETFRAPTMDEIYFLMDWGVIPGIGHMMVVPNPDLKPETAKTWEGGFGLNFDSLVTPSDQFRFKAVSFTEKVFDFISATQTPSVNPGTGIIEYTNINVGEVHRYGFEVELGYRFKAFSLNAAYGVVNGEDKASNEKTGSVPHTLTLTLGWDLPAQNLNFYWKSKCVAGSDYVIYGGGPDSIPGYAIHGMGMVWTPNVSFARGMRVDLGLDNLLDREYVNYRGGVDKGRDFKMACALSF